MALKSDEVPITYDTLCQTFHTNLHSRILQQMRSKAPNFNTEFWN